MPHTPASLAIVVRKDGGGETTAMAQAQVESYLANLLEADRLANLKQALNDVFNGIGKPTGQHRFNDKPVMHASSGNVVKSVTLFYYMSGSLARIFAMGEHASSASYTVSDFGQRGTAFQKGRTITL